MPANYLSSKNVTLENRPARRRVTALSDADKAKVSDLVLEAIEKNHAADDYIAEGALFKALSSGTGDIKLSGTHAFWSSSDMLDTLIGIGFRVAYVFPAGGSRKCIATIITL